MVVEIITLGARIITIQVPNKNYIFENIVLDFDKVSGRTKALYRISNEFVLLYFFFFFVLDYFKGSHFFNCLVGRVAGPGAQQDQNTQKKNTEFHHQSKTSSILSNPRQIEFSINEDIFGFDKVN